jgi:hypothetical protein
MSNKNIPKKNKRFLSKRKKKNNRKVKLTVKNGEYDYLVPDNETKMPLSWERNKISWLSNIDIANVMRNYEKTKKGFHFLTPTPIDFDKKDVDGSCLVSDLCKYDLEVLCKEYKYFGTVFNLSPSTEEGVHWMAMFVDIPKRQIYYYDSVGPNGIKEQIIPPEVEKLLLRFQEQGNNYLYKRCILRNENWENKRKFKIHYNKRRHQYLETECGMYCLYFIYCMLEKESFLEFCKKPIKDEIMVCFRSKFFKDEKDIYKESCERLFNLKIE